MDTLQRRKLEKQKKLEEQIVQEQQLTYQVVLDYLLEEGFASTEKSADSIILNMSEAWFQHIIDEDDKSYDRNRKRAAQRAAARNAARAAGKTGVVPGVGYVTAKKEKESYIDSKGVERHKSGAKNEEFVNEEGADSLKDRQLERGGMGARRSPKKPISNTPNTFGKKKPEYDGMSAVEKVKAAIEKQYGKGAIVDTKKKKK